MSAYRDLRTGGRWRYRVQVRLPDGSSKRIEGTPNVNSERAAAQAERDHVRREEEAIRNPPPPKPKEVPTFAGFATTFMATYAATNNKPSEVESKRSILDTHLLPALGWKRLDAINAQDVEDLKAALLAKGRSRKRINTVVATLGKILRYAFEIELIERAPKIKMLKLKPQAFNFFTPEEFERLVAALVGEPEWYALTLVAGEAGLRLGEILALEWGDVDLKVGTLTVMRSDWRGHIGSPKSGKDRKIPLTARLTNALKVIRHLRSKLVFCGESGDRLCGETVRRTLGRQQTRVGLKVSRPVHTLRHTFCSRLAAAGAPAIQIKTLAGHSSIAVTNRYMHSGGERSAIDLLETDTVARVG